MSILCYLKQTSILIALIELFIAIDCQKLVIQGRICRNYTHVSKFNLLFKVQPLVVFFTISTPFLMLHEVHHVLWYKCVPYCCQTDVYLMQKFVTGA